MKPQAQGTGKPMQQDPTPARGEPKLPEPVRDLVARCLNGDSTAVVELVERFTGPVYGLCYRMLRHRQDAEDVTQESLLRAIRSLSHWDSAREFSPWLLAIAGNRCRTFLSLRSRRTVRSLPPDELADRAADPWAHRNLREEVDQALAQVREEYRQAFLLFHEQQLSYQEIAAALGCPLGTVKTWVHRARRELVRHLMDRGVVEETGHAVP